MHIDDTVREYLWPIAAGRMRGVKLPTPVQRASDNFDLLITTGFLPQRFRDEMRLEWDDSKQRRFDRADRRPSLRQQPVAELRAAVPVQRAAEGRRLADQDGPPSGLRPRDAINLDLFGETLEVLWAKAFEDEPGTRGEISYCAAGQHFARAANAPIRAPVWTATPLHSSPRLSHSPA